MLMKMVPCEVPFLSRAPTKISTGNALALPATLRCPWIGRHPRYFLRSGRSALLAACWAPGDRRPRRRRFFLGCGDGNDEVSCSRWERSSAVQLRRFGLANLGNIVLAQRRLSAGSATAATRRRRFRPRPSNSAPKRNSQGSIAARNLNLPSHAAFQQRTVIAASPRPKQGAPCRAYSWKTPSATSSSRSAQAARRRRRRGLEAGRLWNSTTAHRVPAREDVRHIDDAGIGEMIRIDRREGAGRLPIRRPRPRPETAEQARRRRIGHYHGGGDRPGVMALVAIEGGICLPHRGRKAAHQLARDIDRRWCHTSRRGSGCRHRSTARCRATTRCGRRRPECRS